MANPECARGGGVNHILAEKRGVGFTLFLKMHENAIFSPIREGRTPAMPYAGSATEGGTLAETATLHYHNLTLQQRKTQSTGPVSLLYPKTHNA